MARKVKNQTNHIEGVGVGMKVINKVKERSQIEEVKAAEQKRIKQEDSFKKAQDRERFIDFDIDRRTWQEFINSMYNGGLRRIYGHEMVGGIFYIPEQIEAAHKFLELSIRDRQQIKELIVEQYSEHYQNVKLTIESNIETTTALRDEANKLGLNYTVYLRALFYTRVFDINQEQLKLIKEREEQLRDAAPINVSGSIKADLRKMLKEKYGMPKGGFIPHETYFDLLIRAAYESFENK